MWYFFFHCKLNTRPCGGLQTQGINSAISSPTFFCPGMKMVVLGNGYFYTAICSLRTGLRPPVVYHWLLNSYRAVQITSELGYALTRDGKSDSKNHLVWSHPTPGSPFNPVFWWHSGNLHCRWQVEIPMCFFCCGEKNNKEKWEMLLQYLVVHWKDHSAWDVWVVGVMTGAGWFLSSSSIFRLGRHSFRCSAALGRDFWIVCM